MGFHQFFLYFKGVFMISTVFQKIFCWSFFSAVSEKDAGECQKKSLLILQREKQFGF